MFVPKVGVWGASLYLSRTARPLPAFTLPPACLLCACSYFTTIITTLVFLFVPFNSLVFGYHPVTFSYEFALAATIYLPLNWMLMNYVRKPQHMKGQWLAQVSNHILCFTYIKAVLNTLL